MKWQSVLVNDLRNQMGKEIIGSRWKGRGYFKAYAVPSNPRTLTQEAYRDMVRLVNQYYQLIVPLEEDAKEAWEEKASISRISGFNEFFKLNRGNIVSCPAELEENTPYDIEITYTATRDVGDIMLFVRPVGPYYYKILDIDEVSDTPDSKAYWTTNETNRFDFFFLSKTIVDLLSGAEDIRSLAGHFYPIFSTGEAHIARCYFTKKGPK